jgi:hypothetical protein
MRAGVEDFADFVYWRIRSWTRMPEALFTASVSNSYLWSEIVRELRLERLIEKVEVDSPWVAQQLDDSVKFFDTITDSWWKQPGFAATFLYAPHPGRRLRFVTDTSLRESLLIDIQEAERALASRSYKSAIVMSGAAAEAILLAVLVERTKLSKPKLVNQGLSDYVQHVESEPNVEIEKGTLNIINETLRFWRNVVHPGRIEREAVLIDADKATLAVHALRTLIAELDR